MHRILRFPLIVAGLLACAATMPAVAGTVVHGAQPYGRPIVHNYAHHYRYHAPRAYHDRYSHRDRHHRHDGRFGKKRHAFSTRRHLQPHTRYFRHHGNHRFGHGLRHHGYGSYGYGNHSYHGYHGHGFRSFGPGLSYRVPGLGLYYRNY